MHRSAAPVILLVEDERAMLEQLTKWLFSQGFNAVCATSCLEARAVLEAIAVDGLMGQLALRDGSLFDLVHLARRTASVVIGYADVDVRRPPELDACFVRPLDLDGLGTFLGVRFGRRRSGQLPRVASERRHSVLPFKRRQSS